MEKYAVIVSRDKQESAWITLSWWFVFETQVITLPMLLIIASYAYYKEQESRR